MNKICFVYDDSVKPNTAISNITGGKSFGNTIFKRVLLSNHMKNIVSSNPNVAIFSSPEDIATMAQHKDFVKYPVIVLYSCFIISNEKEFNVLLEKASFAHENYKVLVNDKIACVIYRDLDSFVCDKAKESFEYPEIKCSAFTDISDVNNFRQFITSGFEARYFNSVSGNDFTVVKRSKKIDKLEKEYRFYGLLPDSMKQWFVMPYDYKVDGDVASYSMERFHMADLAIRYVHGAISLEEFGEILNKLFYFIGQRIQKQVSETEYEAMSENLYIKKVDERIAQLKSCDDFSRLERMIQDNTDYSSIDDIIARYKKIYREIRTAKSFKNILVVSHGDLCFSNILYSHEASLVKLIDPKGALSVEDLYMDPYYDIAKLSHSVCGCYDYFNSDLYEIVFNEDLKAHVEIDFDNSAYVNMFKDKLSELAIDFRLIRLYEASLFLSMLPLHIDRPKKVFGFLLNAVSILDSIKE